MSNRRGFTIIEILLALTLGSIIGLALTKLIMSQTRFFTQQQAIRDARSGSRAALNVLMSDLRMVEARGGVVSATATDITVRVPYQFGVMCNSTAGAMIASMVPVDSAVAAGAAMSGYAWRDTLTGSYTYVDGAARAPGAAVTCTIASITAVAGGSTASLTPGVLVTAGQPSVGTPVFVYQRIRYYFAESTLIPGRTALWRQVVATGVASELVTPMQSTSSFKFYTLNEDTARTAVPASLADIRGFQLLLNGASEKTPPGRSTPQQFDLTTAVFFQNRNN